MVEYKVNLRWLTPVLLTINVFILGYLVQRVDAAESKSISFVQATIGKQVSALSEELKKTRETMIELKIEVALLKNSFEKVNH